jgi:predicted transcriptional regulator
MQVANPSADLGREAIASEVRSLMGRRRVSQTALARLLGISQSALSRRLVGEQPFDTDELFVIARHLGVERIELAVARDARGETVYRVTATPSEQQIARLGWKAKTSNVRHIGDRIQRNRFTLEATAESTG